MMININKSDAKVVSFEEAFSQTSTKPMAVLIYSDWADNYQNFIINFRNLQNHFGNNFNFVELDIASKEMKAFNDRYEMYPKIPYIILYRNSGKVSRIIQRNCVLDSSCAITKMKSFLL